MNDHDALFSFRLIMEDFNIVDKKSINNELLSNALRGLLYSVPDEDIVDSIDQFFNDDDVYEARKLLVKHFFHLFIDDNEEPNGRHMGPKEREIKKEENMKSIIQKMGKIARMDHDVEFCVPWNYNYIVVSDEEKRFREMVRQKDVEMDSKFSALEDVIDQKNKDMIQVMEKMIKQLGNVEMEGEVYIHTPDMEDAANLKGMFTLLPKRNLPMWVITITNVTVANRWLQCTLSHLCPASRHAIMAPQAMAAVCKMHKPFCKHLVVKSSWKV